MSIRLSLQQVCSELSTSLSPLLTAYLACEPSGETIRKWAQGDFSKKCSYATEKRLRTAYNIVKMLEGEVSIPIRGWFIQERYWDTPPIVLIRNDDLEEAMFAAEYTRANP